MKTKRALWAYRGAGSVYEVGSLQRGSSLHVYVFLSVDGVPPFSRFGGRLVLDFGPTQRLCFDGFRDVTGLDLKPGHVVRLADAVAHRDRGVVPDTWVIEWD